ncbi:hypothetical protein DYB37_000495 [Aphanomyces astaci]|uniref:FYVE-type domain-containing protein n=1 Tax=Aphanomyces astaci TaxID=112090 RepID=A0A418FG80_APHAT|nr:hypothetical protein DYB37_000495 [Aphanomyces astaci]
METELAVFSYYSNVQKLALRTRTQLTRAICFLYRTIHPLTEPRTEQESVRHHHCRRYMYYTDSFNYQKEVQNKLPTDAGNTTPDLRGRSNSQTGNATSHMSVSSSNSFGSANGASGGQGGQGGQGNSLYLFPMVEKMFRIKITEDVERDLRYLGQSRADALISEFDMTPVKEQKGVQLYEVVEQEFYTMKAVVLTPKASIHDVMNLMDMATTNSFRDTMGDIFGALFLDGVVLYASPKDVTRPNESLTVNWMALQSSKAHLPHRDYVFLKYGDCFGRESSLDADPHGSGSNSFVGASIWESIEFDGCGPLPESQNVVRLKFRRCGFVIEESLTNDSLKVSFYLSESHPGRSSVSNLTKSWMTKLLLCVSEISATLMTKHLSEQTLLARHEFTKDGHCCFICLTKFSLMRRKHHCRVCGDVVCGKCSQIKSVRQNGVNKDVRICLQCSSASSVTSNSNRNSSTSSNGFVSHPSSHKIRALTSSGSSNSLFNGGGGSSVSSTDSASGFDYTEYQKPHKNVILEGTETPTPRQPSPKIVLQPHYAASPSSSSSGMSSTQVRYGSSKPSSDMILLDQVDVDTLPSTLVAAFPSSSSTPSTMTPPLLTLASSSMAVPSNVVVKENSTFSYALSYSQRQEWPKAPLPRNEPTRLLKVRSLYLMDPDNQFQDMVDVASTTLSCSIAAICVIGDKTGFMLAKLGLGKREVSRNILFDAHTIMSSVPTIVLDATQDVRFVHNPLVVDGIIHFYVGIPLVASDGAVVGSFSVADHVARKELTGDQLYFLQNLANLALKGIEANTAKYTTSQRNPLAASDLSVVTNGTATYSQSLDEDLDLKKAANTMQELLNKAYATQVKVTLASTSAPSKK